MEPEALHQHNSKMTNFMQTFQITILAICQKGLGWLNCAMSKWANRISKNIVELGFMNP
jgi:hypothetical protein